MQTLIERLRAAANTVFTNNSKDDEFLVELLSDAADALRELEAENFELREEVNSLEY